MAINLFITDSSEVIFTIDSSQTGPQGPPGQDANLPAGSTNQVLRHDGSDWVATSQMQVGDNVVIQADASGGNDALRVHGAIENKDSQSNRVIGQRLSSSAYSYGNSVFGNNIGLNISSSATNNILLGNNLGYGPIETMSQSTLIGSNLMNRAKNGSYNTLIGDNMIVIGNQSNYIMGMTAIGTRNFYSYIGSPTQNDRHANTAIGSENFFSLQFGLSNIGIGANNCRGTTSSDSSIAIGRSIFHPYSQVLNNVIAIGKWAGLYYSSGTHTATIFIGTEAARSGNLGDYSICIGYKAGRQNTAATGKQICIGYQAGRSTSKPGIFIGTDAGNGNAYSTVVVIGDNAQADAANQIAIGSSTYTDAAIFISATGKDGYAMRYNESAGKVELTQDRITATATLDFPSTAAQSSSELTVTVTGAVAGDVASIGVGASAAAAGGSYFAWVSAADTVTVRFCNHTASAIDPPSDTFKITVLK